MTDAPVNKGVLTDKEGAGFPGCRILVDGEQQDRAFTVLSFVQKYLDAIPKKARVCFQTKEGKISKIWEDKPAGEQKKEDCTSTSSTPAANPSNSTGLKHVEGQIIALDVPAHKIVLKTREGEQHTFIWPPAMHDKMSQLKQWWFASLTGEYEKDFDLWRLTAQDFYKRPDDWPAPNRSGGQGDRQFQPRNEKPIIMQVIFKEACETARQLMKMSEKFDEVEADVAWEWAVAKTEATMDRLCKVAGVQ